MDTKEKSREQVRQHKPQQERRRKPSPEEVSRQTSPRSQRQTGTRTASQQKAAPQQSPAVNTSRQNPEQRRGERQNMERRSGAQKPEQQAVRRQRPQQTLQNAASVQRPARQEGDIRFSAPQGTGPRMSAPKMSAQEMAAQRKQRSQTAKQTTSKRNALQNFISGTSGQEDLRDPAEKARQRRKQRAAREEKKRRRTQRYDTPTIIYTQPQAFNRDKLLLQLFTVTAIVAAMVVGMSVFFKVKNITVAGAETYSNQAVQDASGIQVGDNLLTFSKARASAQIRAKLSYVDNIRIGIKLPDTVIIYIEELDVAYAVESGQGDWWLINSDGRVVEQINYNESSNYTKVLGVSLDNPQPGNQAIAADFVMQDLLASGENQEGAETVETIPTAEPVPLAVTGAQRLASALQILKALEANDIVGEAASIDVSDLEDVTLLYGSRYEVLLGDTSRMEYKIACMNDAILQMSDYQAGILDVSFINWPDQVGYTPFG